MHYRLMGHTGLYVSELCLGTMTFGGRGFWSVVGTLDSSMVQTMLGQAFEAGINFLDTADVYSEGQSEELVGEALRAMAYPREQLVIATKCRGRVGPGPNQVGLTRKHILSAVDASLKRLQIDYIDLYQIHGVDKVTPIEETMDALDSLVQAGKVRYIGYCNLPAWLTVKANAYAMKRKQAKFVSAQVYYSIAGRDIEREVVPMAEDQNLAILPWSPLAGGLLTGKFDLESPGPEGTRRAAFDFPPVDKERAKPILAAMRTIAEESGETIPRIALAWLLTRPFITSLIIGAKTPAQLADNLGATDITLSPEQIARLDEVSALPSEYPGWMVSRQGSDRIPDGAR